MASLHQISTIEPHVASEVADFLHPLGAGVQGRGMRVQGGLLALCGKGWAVPGRCVLPSRAGH